jgi:hypothetical protein
VPKNKLQKKQEEEENNGTKDYLTEGSTPIKHRQTTNQLTIAKIARKYHPNTP